MAREKKRDGGKKKKDQETDNNIENHPIIQFKPKTR